MKYKCFDGSFLEFMELKNNREKTKKKKNKNTKMNKKDEGWCL
nr:hypothetical protein [uncultured Methanolobus sp.]